MPDNLISGVRFEPDGIEIAYMRPGTDVRAGGNLVATHSLWVADRPDYADEIEEVRRAIYVLLNDALEDHQTSDPVDLTDLDDDDDD